MPSQPTGPSHRVSRNNRTRAALVLLLVLVVAAGGIAYALRPDDSGRDAPTSTVPSSTGTPSTSPASAVKPIVLAISVDGLNPEALTTLGRTGAPSFWKLIDGGASTLNARTSYELTITLPNHTGMMTGRRVSGDGGTSVTFNEDSGGTLESTHGEYVAGLFDVAHDHGIRTALFAEKGKFEFLLRSWDGGHGAADSVGADDGRDKIDDSAIARSEQLVPKVREVVTDPGDAATVIFWHIAAPDVAGHTRGWLSPPYLSAVQNADSEIGSILEVIESDPALKGRTTILLTADHGGPRGQRHHDQANLLANYRIPFIAWGNQVSAGADLYDLNSRRKDPATARPDYNGPQPIRNFDLADTALALLGLPELVGAGAPVSVR